MRITIIQKEETRGTARNPSWHRPPHSPGALWGGQVCSQKESAGVGRRGTTNTGGKLSIVGGKSNLTKTNFPADEIAMKGPSNHPVFQDRPAGRDIAAGNLFHQTEEWRGGCTLRCTYAPPTNLRTRRRI